MKPPLPALASRKVPLARLNCPDPPRESVEKERELGQRKKKKYHLSAYKWNER